MAFPTTSPTAVTQDRFGAPPLSKRQRRLGYADAPRVSLYVGWTYALLKGGPHQARASRTHSDSTPWHSALPELVLPADRTWLVSTLWDDDWRCIGRPAALVDAVLLRPELEARAVRPDEDMTPPGHDVR